MYATAHRVSRDERSDINAFLYLHGRDFSWPADASALPEEDPGTLSEERQVCPIPPGANPVHSYLDVLAPDETRYEVLLAALQAFRRDVAERRNPTIFTTGAVTIRFGVQLGLEPRREAELDALIGTLLRVLPAP
jgi:hypothetical protein